MHTLSHSPARTLHDRTPVRRSAGQVRIIGGKWRSRRIAFPAEPGLRPTPDRIRETLFNWLGQSLDGYHCLDLFAGSGVLGFESLSRGASSATLVEGNPSVVRCLQQSAAQLMAADAQVVRSDALEFLRRNAGRRRFDLIFLDPPFSTGLQDPVVQLLPDVLAPGGLVYLESPAAPDLPEGWRVEKSGKAGNVHFHLTRWGPE